MPITSGKGSSSSGTRYRIVQNPGQSFPITCSPSVVFSGTAAAGPPITGSGNGLGSLSYSATAQPLEVVLSGGIGTKNSKRYLIGQHVQARVSTGGLTATSYNWSVSGGQPFKYYHANTLTAFVTQMGAETGNLLDFYFRKPTQYDGGPAIVTCSCHLSVPTGMLPTNGFDVIPSQPCSVEKPNSWLTVDIGTVQPEPLPPASAMRMHLYGIVWSDGTSTLHTGIRWRGTVTTAPEYGHEGIPGWNYTQLITPGRALRDASTTHTLIPNGTQVLDSEFGYMPTNGGVYPDDGTPETSGDAPSNEFGAPYISSIVHESFVTYTLYRPPGSDSLWVPLKELQWFWQGAASPDTGSVWSVSNTAAMWGFVDDFPPHPQWNGNVAPLTYTP